MNTPLTPACQVKVSGSVQIRVRYCECDPMGVAHHAAYIPWLEIGRTELLRDTGITYAQLEQSGIFLVIAKLECRYRRPIFYDDLVEVRTKVVGGGRVKIQHEYEIALVDDGQRGGGREARSPGDILFAASSTLGCVGADGRITTMPEWLMPESR